MGDLPLRYPVDSFPVEDLAAVKSPRDVSACLFALVDRITKSRCKSKKTLKGKIAEAKEREKKETTSQREKLRPLLRGIVVQHLAESLSFIVSEQNTNLINNTKMKEAEQEEEEEEDVQE
ncbi:hypothetical protein RUM44_003656 [Polyplax serrata]|uniref:Uncharacterized protein n=1 Tax=Polyplax serrata TaxID=468196 RepID=A0ABR1AH22_POLSC